LLSCCCWLQRSEKRMDDRLIQQEIHRASTPNSRNAAPHSSRKAILIQADSCPRQRSALHAHMHTWHPIVFLCTCTTGCSLAVTWWVQIHGRSHRDPPSRKCAGHQTQVKQPQQPQQQQQSRCPFGGSSRLTAPPQHVNMHPHVVF